MIDTQDKVAEIIAEEVYAEIKKNGNLKQVSVDIKTNPNKIMGWIKQNLTKWTLDYVVIKRQRSASASESYIPEIFDKLRLLTQ
ncbi:MAG: hypothetical protein ACOCUH_03840 [Bacteriovoracia bacterium]